MPESVLGEQIEAWRRSRLSPMLRELAIGVLRRAYQGMSDQDICWYLDSCKRGLDPESAQARMVEMTREALLREGSRLRKGVDAIREELAVIEAERERARQIGQSRRDAGTKEISSREIREVWRDEIQYKNSLIRPGARGGNRSGRKRKKEARRTEIRRAYINAVMRRHDEAMRRKNGKGKG